MFSGRNNEEATKAIAQKFFDLIEKLNLDVARLQESRITFGQTLERIQSDLDRIVDEQSGYCATSHELKNFKTQISHIEQRLDDFESAIGALKSDTGTIKSWVEGEKARRQEQKEDARSIRLSVMTWGVIGVLTFFSGVIASGLWVRMHQIDPPRLEQAN